MGKNCLFYIQDLTQDTTGGMLILGMGGGHNFYKLYFFKRPRKNMVEHNEILKICKKHGPLTYETAYLRKEQNYYKCRICMREYRREYRKLGREIKKEKIINKEILLKETEFQKKCSQYLVNIRKNDIRKGTLEILRYMKNEDIF